MTAARLADIIRADIASVGGRAYVSEVMQGTYYVATPDGNVLEFSRDTHKQTGPPESMRVMSAEEYEDGPTFSNRRPPRHELSRASLEAAVRLLEWGYGEWINSEQGCQWLREWQQWSAEAYQRNYERSCESMRGRCEDCGLRWGRHTPDCKGYAIDAGQASAYNLDGWDREAEDPRKPSFRVYSFSTTEEPWTLIDWTRSV